MDTTRRLRTLLRFCRDRRGGTVADYAVVAALLMSTRQVAILHGDALSRLFDAYLPH